MHDKLKERIKQHEGFRNYVYLDSLGKKTVGYGHLCRDDEDWDIKKSYSIQELEVCFESDFNNALVGAERLIGDITIDPKAKEVIIEMVFQLGETGVSKFKKMWAALKEQDYINASNEMLDSKWAEQTEKRAESLARIIRSLA